MSALNRIKTPIPQNFVVLPNSGANSAPQRYSARSFAPPCFSVSALLCFRASALLCFRASALPRLRASVPPRLREGLLSASAVLSALFRASVLQRFSASALPRFRASALPRFRASTLQRFNASTLQRFNASTQELEDANAEAAIDLDELATSHVGALDDQVYRASDRAVAVEDLATSEPIELRYGHVD